MTFRCALLAFLLVGCNDILGMEEVALSESEGGGGQGGSGGAQPIDSAGPEPTSSGGNLEIDADLGVPAALR